MSDNKKYRLLKDYPGIKSGEIIEPNTYGIPVTSDQIKTSTWPLFYSVDGSILNAWVPCTALNNKEWFEEITPEQSKLQSQDKPQPSSIDRIEVKDNKVIISHLSAHDNFKGHDTAHWYQFCSNKPLYSYPNSKIISAIEQAINGKEENNEELVGLLRDAVSSTWGNTSLEQTQILFDKFLHDRKLAKPTQGLINAFLTDAVNRNIYDKKYSQSEVDTIRKESFEAAKKHEKFILKYPKYEDYLKSLSTPTTQPKEEDKPVKTEWFVNSYWEVHSKAQGSHHPADAAGNKYFPTKEAAEQYILENKPCLSLNEVKELANNNGAKVLCIPDEKISNYAKQKQTKQ